MAGRTRETDIELYVRSLAPRDVRTRQTALVETLEDLSQSGQIGDYTVWVCGQEAPTAPESAVTEFGRVLLDRIEQFHEWADKNDHSLGPLFERRTLDSALTGETHETIVLPVMALSEYEGRDLRVVTPCEIDGETVTVQDRIEQLGRGDAIGTERLQNVREPSGETPEPPLQ